MQRTGLVCCSVHLQRLYLEQKSTMYAITACSCRQILSAGSPKAWSPVETRTVRRLVHRCKAATPGPAIASTSTSTQVLFRTKQSCELAVSIYPKFGYNASGGGATGSVQDIGNGLVKLTFDPATISIPQLNWRTTTFLFVPLPPPLEISIEPSKLEGTLEVATGRMELEFVAQFKFTVGSLYCAPPLNVVTVLTTETSSGQIHTSTGRRLGNDGGARLVGVARVPKVQDWFLDNFLMLPTDALAILDADFELS